MTNKGVDIRRRIANHEAAIVANWQLFDSFFNDITWKQMYPLNSKHLRGRYVTKKVFTPKDDLFLLGVILKAEYNYAPTSDVLSIIFHFKRRYEKLKEIK